MSCGDRDERVTEDEVRGLGWNSCNPGPEHIGANGMVHAQQLQLIGLLLLDIRDRLDVLIDREPPR